MKRTIGIVILACCLISCGDDEIEKSSPSVQVIDSGRDEQTDNGAGTRTGPGTGAAAVGGSTTGKLAGVGSAGTGTDTSGIPNRPVRQ